MALETKIMGCRARSFLCEFLTIEGVQKVIALAKNLAINKKSTILIQSS